MQLPLKFQWRRLIFWACAGIMALCLAGQGLLLFARNGVSPDPLPFPYVVSDWVFYLLVASFLLYFSRPVVTLVVSWLVLLATVFWLERFTEQAAIFWFWYDRVLMPVFIIAAHLGFFLQRKARRTQARTSSPTSNV